MALVNRGSKLTDSTIAVFSDIHCGSHQNSATWHNVTLEWGKWVKEILKKRGITDIIIPGDVFHDRNEVAVNTLQTVCALFKEWESFNIIITVGNHDAFYRDNSKIHSLSVLSGWNNIHVVDETELLEVFGKKILFVPWGDDETELYPDVDIIFGHFEIETFKMNATKVCMHGINAKSLLKKSELVISGHFHHRDERKYNDGTILYLGSPYQLDWGDCGTTRGITILDIKKMSLEFIPNGISPQHNKIKVSEIISKGKIDNILTKKIKGNIIKLIVDSNLTTEQVETLTKKITTLNPFTLNVEWLYNNELGNIDTEIDGINIEECITDFIEAMPINNKKEVLEKTLELYKIHQNA